MERVAGRDHGHAGHHPHHPEILEPGVGRPGGATAEATHRPDDLDREVRVGDVGADLLMGPHRRERREGHGERDLAVERQPGRHAHQVLLGDPDVEEALGMGVLESLQLVRQHQVGGEGDYLGVLTGELDERLTVDLARIGGAE